MMDDRGVFNIGKRNQLALKKLLWKAGLMLHGEETGGDLSRTVRMEVASGRTFLRPGGGLEKEWSLPRPACISGGNQ
jgi:chemotaxis protein CheD